MHIFQHISSRDVQVQIKYIMKQYYLPPVNPGPAVKPVYLKPECEYWCPYDLTYIRNKLDGHNIFRRLWKYTDGWRDEECQMVMKSHVDMLVFWKTQLTKLETGKRRDFRYVYLKESDFKGKGCGTPTHRLGNSRSIVFEPSRSWSMGIFIKPSVLYSPSWYSPKG